MDTGAVRAQRTRGTILEFLRTNHDRQQPEFNATLLWSSLTRGLGFPVSRNSLRTLLQDLCARGYITYAEGREDDDGIRPINHIKLTPKGRDVLEGTIVDPAVEV